MTEFYLRDSRSDCGTNAMFHSKSSGYVTALSIARTYSLEEAQQWLDSRMTDIPLLKSAVDAVSILTVDHQYLDIGEDETSPSDRYVIQIKGRWNGNDIYFVGETDTTFNFSEAKVFGLEDAKHYVSASTSYLDCFVMPYETVEAVARPTLQIGNISTRKMITAPGIKYKKPRKPRPTTGKIRGNCEKCGRITWTYDPHEQPICDDCDCL